MPTIWTIGHSTRPIAEFVALLRANALEAIADVRRFPASRRHPHYNADALAATLAENAIAYRHFPELGGRRRPLPDSRNTNWRNASFRGYADYMESAAFRAAIEELTVLASTRRTAILCAEALWWRCHRGLIADYLQVRGAQVSHIVAAHHIEPHPYTAAARVEGGHLSYSPGDSLF